MADDDTDTPGTGAADKKDTPAQKKQVKNEHVLIIVGIVTLVVMVLYMRKSAAAASSTTAATGSVGQSPYGVNSYGGGYGGGAGSSYDMMSQLATDLQTMQSEIVGLTPPTP